MSDYERIATTLRFLDAHLLGQPSLAEVAARAGLSESHLHRLFSRWAGVTPKAFLRCLTVERAKQRLQGGESVLDASLGLGLSGPGRLHDHCVSLEAASPGEIKSGGAGWDIAYGVSQSPFGWCLLAEGPRGVCHLSFLAPGEEEEALVRMKGEWPSASYRRDDQRAAELAGQVFDRSSGAGGNLRAYVKGSDFQVRVWRALLRIPLGELRSYGSLAAEIGQPSASRAVGSAVGKNGLAYLIPCHRVIRQTGVLGDYRWGSERKRAMLGWEICPRA